MKRPVFSIIVPVYNVEKYIKKCLDSIHSQSFGDFEVIIVNDGSPDNSQVIIDRFVEKDHRMKSYQKPNGGLSDARNFGVTKATGEYLLFVDSDDFIDPELLMRISIAQSGQDVIRYFHREITESGDILNESALCSGEVSLPARYQFSLVEAAWLYAYRRSFWLANKFEYTVGRLHEDFGLTPIILAKAASVLAIDYIGYNYLRRNESITTDETKRRKRIDDVVWFVANMESAGEILNNEQFKYYANFMTHGLIALAGRAHGAHDIALLVKELKRQRSHRFLVVNSPKRLVKYIAIHFFPTTYLKLLAAKQ